MILVQLWKEEVTTVFTAVQMFTEEEALEKAPYAALLSSTTILQWETMYGIEIPIP